MKTVTIAEMFTFITQLKCCYPHLFKNYDKTMFDMMAQTWLMYLNDFSIQAIEAGLKKHLSNPISGVYCPSIADIRNNVNELKDGKSKTAIEAWEAVLKVVKKFGFYRETEALESLDKDTKRVAEMVGYKDICHSENIDVLRSNFIKCYDQYINSETQYRNMPESLKIIQDKANKKMLATVKATENKEIAYKTEAKPYDFSTLKQILSGK